MSGFAQGLELLFESIRYVGDGQANATVTPCEETIDHYAFYQGFLIPAILITLSFGFTKQRRYLFLDILNGRPGMVFPMDIMTRHTGMSYAAAFGATLHLIPLVIFQGKTAFSSNGPSELRTLTIIPSMIIYGLVYFPVFACLAIKSTYGYIMGSLYIWSFTALSVYQEFQCAGKTETVIIVVFRGIPQFACLIYLCICIPGRCYKALKTKKNIFDTISEENISETLDDIKDSYVGRHVRKLFLKPPPKPEIPEDFKGKMVMKLKMFWNRWVYKRDDGFKYSSRFKSVVFVGALLVYILSFESIVAVILFFNISSLLIEKLKDNIKLQVGLSDDVAKLELIQAFYEGLRICCILAVVCAMFINLISILHTMTSYRKNLRALHKGIHTHIPAINTRSNSRLLVGSMRYAGYQMGYIAWGFVIQSVIFLLLFMVIWALVDIPQLFIILLKWLWPIIISAVVFNVLQILLAKFFFLQERGTHLALENRRLLFSFTYFMFFYNIFLGLVSCLLRIVKAIVLGALLLSRLDNSTLPERFQFFDPGFAAYVGFMHIENSHNHPVVLVLARILLASRRNKLKSAVVGLDRDVSFSNIETGNETIGQSNISEEDTGRKKAVRFNWHVAYTLINNPELRLYRKGSLQALKKTNEVGGDIIPVSENVYTDLPTQINQPQKPKINNSNFLKRFKLGGYVVQTDDM